MESRTRSSSNYRASFAVLFGVAAVFALPAGIALAERYANVKLVDASWAIPVAFALGLVAIALANLARTRVQLTVGRAGGEGRARAARILGTVGICLALTASISVGFYELLLRLEK
jgi:hypothetical protein